MAGLHSRLRRRSEFLAVASTGQKWVTPGMIVQIRPDNSFPHFRYGLTASRKVGGAVQRNRARRRLRALAEQILPQLVAEFGLGTPVSSVDLVLIARTHTIGRSFDDLQADLRWAIKRLAQPKPPAASSAAPAP